jgi:hypothetical protein
MIAPMRPNIIAISASGETVLILEMNCDLGELEGM